LVLRRRLESSLQSRPEAGLPFEIALRPALFLPSDFGLQPFLFQHFAGRPQAFHGLRDTAINADYMDNGAQFFLCDAVADCSAAMKFPLVHLPERADHGEIHIHGVDLFDERLIAKKHIGYLPEQLPVYRDMSVLEFLRYCAHLRGMPKERHKASIDRVIQRCGLVDVAKRLIANLSKGYQQRVGIARAIVMKPKYLFCDEPNSGLDPKTSTLIDNLIQEITKEYQITTVINTHDMNSVMEIGEKVLFLENGRKGWEGSNREVFKTENESVGNFIYSSNLFKKVREVYQEEN
jgi:phospholipid/cholesterol/gamma-HCH transport system ATP-binding protein